MAVKSILEVVLLQVIVQTEDFLCVHCWRLSRKTFDTPETYKEFGPIRIEFGKV